MEQVYARVAGLALTNAYVGVIEVSGSVEDSQRSEIAAVAVPGMEAWYFRHAGGELWIGAALEHPEPVIGWLAATYDRLPCTTILTVAVRNGAKLPRASISAFRVNAGDECLREILARHYTIYLHHSDEFLIVTDPDAAASFVAEFHELRDYRLELELRDHRRVDLPQKTKERTRYDPIRSQLKEVRTTVTDGAKNAVTQLSSQWKAVFCSEPPSDVAVLQTRIAEETQGLDELLANTAGQQASTDLLGRIDRYAQTMRQLRQRATDLRQKIREYGVPTSERMRYDVAATPTMLRALHSYSIDVARQLGLGNFVFVPVIGEQFRMTTNVFPLDSDNDETMVLIEVPDEIRLRLGAIPIIARHLAALVDEKKIDAVADAFLYREPVTMTRKKRRSVMDDLVPSIEVRPDRSVDEELRRYDEIRKQIAHVVAADLIATAVAGPPFVFAMARFAVGTIGDLASANQGDRRPSFRDRLTACLQLLNALGIDAQFDSRYLPPVKAAMPESVVKAVADAVPHVRKPAEEELVEVTAALRDGRIVDTFAPTVVLTALWRAVAQGTGYLHEIAALVSVAAARSE